MIFYAKIDYYPTISNISIIIFTQSWDQWLESWDNYWSFLLLAEKFIKLFFINIFIIHIHISHLNTPGGMAVQSRWCLVCRLYCKASSLYRYVVKILTKSFKKRFAYLDLAEKFLFNKCWFRTLPGKWQYFLNTS